MEDRIPAELFPPGEYLRDELGARGWSHSKFAGMIGCDPSTVDRIVSGEERITPETASLLEAGLGVSAQVWVNLEAAYRQGKDPTK